MSSILDALGLDEDEFTWRDLSLCRGTDTELFFDLYESNVQIAKTTDEMCLSCPIMKQCLQSGIDNQETGVWGGIWLTIGKVDNNRNKHKTQEVWDEITGRIG